MRRGFTIALLLVEALFFNVIIPGHTRGVIQLAGSQSQASCCASRHGESKQTPCDNKRAANCAICAFAARLTVPLAIDFAPPPTGLVAILRPSAPQLRISATFS